MRITGFIYTLISILLLSTGNAMAQSGSLKTPAEYGFAESVAPLLTGIEYGQNTPFNGMCPVLENGALAGSDDKRAHTGCAATAVASVLKFFATTKDNNIQPLNPASETWTYTSTDNVNPNNTQTITNNISEHTYDWSLIRGTYNGTLGTDYTQEEAGAIAQLMVDCGYALRMNYTQVTSDAGHEIIPNALYKYFGFNGMTMQTYYRNTTSQELWEKTIYGELAAGRPVLIKGFLSGGGGGHEYVVDGYNAEGYLHVNFGNADGGKYVPVYEHENYVLNFSIITGIQFVNTVTNAYRPSSNVHRLNDMTYENGQVSFQLRNDGLGKTEENTSGTTTGSKVKTALAVIRDGAVIGYCGVQSQDVTLSTNSDEKYSFDISLTKSTLSVNNLSIPAISAEAKMSGLSTDGSGIQEGDIIIPIVSTDGYGRTWSIPDGNESKVNSIKVKSADLPDGYYRIYQNGKALTAENGSSSLSLSDYDENNDFQIFYLMTTSKGTTLMDFMGEKYCYKNSSDTFVDLLTTGYEDLHSYQGILRAYYTVSNADDEHYSISVNGNYILNSGDAAVYGSVSSTSTDQLWTIEPATPSHGKVTYTVDFKNCPIAEGTNRYIEYNDNQYNNGSLDTNNNQLTADQISAPAKTGYAYEVVINNSNYTITVYYAQDANGDGKITIADVARLIKSANSLTGGPEKIEAANVVIDLLLRK